MCFHAVCGQWGRRIDGRTAASGTRKLIAAALSRVLATPTVLCLLGWRQVGIVDGLVWTNEKKYQRSGLALGFM